MVLCLKAWESRTLPGLLNVNYCHFTIIYHNLFSNIMKICVVGTGYVGLSLALLISQKYNVVALDISKVKVDLINDKRSPIKDEEIESFLHKSNLDLTATTDVREAYLGADYVIIATPTNYDSATGSFDTSSVENVISDCLEINPDTTIVIKSTVPIGFTDTMQTKFKSKNIFFSPEFLRETKSLYDNLYPSRIVVGDTSDKADTFGKILIDCSRKNDGEISIFKMKSKEAEAVKLFANTYLAMRISFFNEMDSYAESQDLNIEKIIKAISSDPRIGNHYNNPSFGYGGYCLPKDTKQLLKNFDNIPNKIVKAVVEANKTRKDFIVRSILNKKPNTVGIYRLTMKEGSNNFRESAVLDIVNELINNNKHIILYEPLMEEYPINNIEVVNNFEDFVSRSDLVIANRYSKELDQVKNKVYTRDVFNEN